MIWGLAVGWLAPEAFGARLQMEKLQMQKSRHRAPMGKDHAGLCHDLAAGGPRKPAITSNWQS